ncbi:hypothetical protein KSF78_0004264 [Schistosoma japonicum]|nr:hypothetical protein KSF78_0004264 [Schistosoma japonicum]
MTTDLYLLQNMPLYSIKPGLRIKHARFVVSQPLDSTIEHTFVKPARNSSCGIQLLDYEILKRDQQFQNLYAQWVVDVELKVLVVVNALIVVIRNV